MPTIASAWLDTSNPLGGLCYRRSRARHRRRRAAGQWITIATAAPTIRATTNTTTLLRASAPPIAWIPKRLSAAASGYSGMASKAGKWTTPATSIPMSAAKTSSQNSGQASYQTTDQLWPSFDTIAPSREAPTAANTFIAVIISEKPKNPYVTQWSFSVERELARNTTLEVNYVGNKGSRLLARQNINQALLLTDLTACFVDPSGISLLPASEPPSISQLRHLYQQFLDRALQLQRVEHQASSIAAASSPSPASIPGPRALTTSPPPPAPARKRRDGMASSTTTTLELDYGRSDFNVGQRFVTSFVYDLPVGRGKQFANQVNPVVNAVIGGWESTGIVTFQQGFPTSIQCYDYGVASNNPTNVGGLLDIATGFGINRCDQVGDPKMLKWTHNSADFAANQALFAAPHTWDVWELGAQRCQQPRH